MSMTANEQIAKWKKEGHIAHEIKVHEVHGGDVCVTMLVKDSYLDSVQRTMEVLGYRNCRTAKEHIGIIETYELEDDMIWTVTAE